MCWRSSSGWAKRRAGELVETAIRFHGVLAPKAKVREGFDRRISLHHVYWG